MRFLVVIPLLVLAMGQGLRAGGPGRALSIDDVQAVYTVGLALPPWTVTVEFWLSVVQVRGSRALHFSIPPLPDPSDAQYGCNIFK